MGRLASLGGSSALLVLAVQGGKSKQLCRRTRLLQGTKVPRSSRCVQGPSLTGFSLRHG